MCTEEFLSSAATHESMRIGALYNPRKMAIVASRFHSSSLHCRLTTGHPPSCSSNKRRGSSPTVSISAETCKMCLYCPWVRRRRRGGGRAVGRKHRSRVAALVTRTWMDPIVICDWSEGYGWIPISIVIGQKDQDDYHSYLWLVT